MVTDTATDADRKFDYWLEMRGYSHHRRQNIRFSLWRTGCLAEAVQTGLLASHHECDAVIFTAVPYDSPEWGDDSEIWTTGPAVPKDAVILPPELGTDALDDEQIGPSAADDAALLELFAPRFSVAV